MPGGNRAGNPKGGAGRVVSFQTQISWSSKSTIGFPGHTTKPTLLTGSRKFSISPVPNPSHPKHTRLSSHLLSYSAHWASLLQALVFVVPSISTTIPQKAHFLTSCSELTFSDFSWPTDINSPLLSSVSPHPDLIFHHSMYYALTVDIFDYLFVLFSLWNFSSIKASTI